MGSASSDITIDEKSEYLQSGQVPGLRIEIALEQKPLRAGFLLKRGFKNFASWKRRYCVLLQDGYFNYYNSKRKIKGSVNFVNAHQCISCSKDNKKFYVLTSKRSWEFKAENKIDANQWIKLIQKIMNISPTENYSKNSKLIKPTDSMKTYNNNKNKEFDSDDDDDDKSHKSHKSSSYIKKHKKRRSTATTTSYFECDDNKNDNKNNKNNKNNAGNISFESWKISIVNSLRDVIIQVQHRQKLKNYNPNNYDDGYHTISIILNDDKKLKTIFNRITNNNKYMTMKQYIASMSLIQKSRTEIGLIATKLLNDNHEENINNNNDDDDAPMPPYVDITNNTNYNYTKKKSAKLPDFDTQSMVSTLSTISYFDDTQSIISDLSTTNRRNNRNRRNRRRTPRYSKSSISTTNATTNDNNNKDRKIHHSFKLSYTANNSIFSNIDGAFSILEQTFIADSDEELQEFDELNFEEEKFDKLSLQNTNTASIKSMKYDDLEYDDLEYAEYKESANIRVEIPVNAASEILGNFLGASCGLCVPGLDVITSIDSAATYKLLSEYTSNIDDSGNPPILLVYEELDGVTLSDLKKQLEVVGITLHYNHQNTSSSSTTTQQRIQKYFVSVVRKTFGVELPYNFSNEGRSMIRDSGFVFAVDMFLFNICRFPVLLPFEGKANPNNLLISTDEDGDSALYGLCNRFMGGHDIIDMPYYLLNGGNTLNDDKSIKLLINKQQQYTQSYIGKLQKFLSVLSDYYQTKISPNIDKMDHSPNKLLHGLPTKMDSNRFAKINHSAIVNKCLRPIANFLYIHCGFELIIIDEYNNNPQSMSPINDDNMDNMDYNDDEYAMKILEIYRNKLIDNMITLICEGILIGISEISDQLEIKDIDIIIQDIKSLDENMFGIQLISAQFLKLVLRLFHSTSVSFKLNIEDSSESDQEH